MFSQLVIAFWSNHYDVFFFNITTYCITSMKAVFSFEEKAGLFWGSWDDGVKPEAQQDHFCEFYLNPLLQQVSVALNLLVLEEVYCMYVGKMGWRAQWGVELFSSPKMLLPVLLFMVQFLL